MRSAVLVESINQLTMFKKRYLFLLSAVTFIMGGCGPEPADPIEVAKSEIFTDQAKTAGLDFVHFNGMTGKRLMAEIIGAGVALFDYDNDGDLDAYWVQGALLGIDTRYEDSIYPFTNELPPLDRLFRNDLVETGRFHFTDVTTEAGIIAPGFGMGVTVGDIDKDGFTDIYVTNFGPNQLLLNNGDGTFEDVTNTSQTDDSRWNTSAAFLDYDRDGWLDLFVGSYVSYSLTTHKDCFTQSGIVDYCGPTSYQPLPDKLFRNKGDGTFEDVSAHAQIAGSYGGSLGVISSDFNSDGWPDIYVANDALPNQLWINQQDGSFRDEALLSGTAVNQSGIPEGSMGVEAADFDGDGDEDLFVTHIAEETNTFYRNLGGGLFEDATSEVGLGLPSLGFTGFGTGALDYDNDGKLDLMVVNGAVVLPRVLPDSGDAFPMQQPNQLLHNLGARFEEVSTGAGSVFNESEVSRGAAFGDIDNDGDIDVMVNNNNGPARLLINNVGHQNNWIGLRLVDQGLVSNGTKVVLTLADGEVLVRRVRVAASYCSANDSRVLFGLGSAITFKALEVLWPDGTAEKWDGVPYSVGTYYTLEKGSGQ